MHTVIRSGELRPSRGGTVTFEGEGYGSGVSFFLVHNEPGAGPDLHKHPYPETWIVRSGQVRFTADREELEAGAGDIVVVGSETPPKAVACDADLRARGSSARSSEPNSRRRSWKAPPYASSRTSAPIASRSSASTPRRG